jgi:peptidoglycan/xylan/chitin deacetylase (PgdA/CDA1 family)
MNQYTKICSLNLIKVLGFFYYTYKISKKKVKILLYHRFSSVPEDEKIYAKEFEKQITHIKKHYNLIAFDQLVKSIRLGESPPDNAVIITVDDGYQDFYLFAYPILKKYSAPATVFLTTEFVEGNIWLWHDIINYSLIRTKNNYLDLDIENKKIRLPVNSNTSNMGQLKKQLFDTCTSLANEKRLQLLNNIVKELKVDLPEKPPKEYSSLQWSQIIEMAQNGISFGAHTCNHPILSRINYEEACYEIYKSKSKIEDVLQKEITTFSYPNGKKDDFTMETKQIVKMACFHTAVSSIYGLNDKTTDMYELKRIPIGGRNRIYFHQDISGFEWYKSKLYQSIGINKN